MPKIPQSTIDRIRDRSDIVDVISEEVSLKRKGVNYFGRCPFHDEKTPSFSVSPSKQIYHCFGCGNGGNVFNFLMEFQKFTFYEAVKLLKPLKKILTQANIHFYIRFMKKQRYYIKRIFFHHLVKRHFNI